MPKVFLDWDGLQAYHEEVKGALDKKENKFHVGLEAPTDDSQVWFYTGDDSEAQVASFLMDEELTFNEDTNDELIFNEEETTTDANEEELTFNESDEELIFNEDSE